MSIKRLIPCENPTIRIECMVCEVLNSKDSEGVDCGIKNMLNLYKTTGYCKSSDDGKKCNSCRHFSYDMDDCVHNGFVAAVFRYANNITEDDRHFEQRSLPIPITRK